MEEGDRGASESVNRACNGDTFFGRGKGKVRLINNLNCSWFIDLMEVIIVRRNDELIRPSASTPREESWKEEEGEEEEEERVILLLIIISLNPD